MILKTVKTVAETGLTGIEFVTLDKQVVEVVIGKLRIRKIDAYSKALEVVVEQPFDKVERFRLTAKIKGFPDAVTYHETKYDADGAGANLEDVGAAIEVERVDVLIDDKGEVVGLADETAPQATSDIPF